MTNLLGVAALALSTNFSHTVLIERPCDQCDTPHVFSLVQVHNVWQRRSVNIMREGKLELFDIGSAAVVDVLRSTNDVHLFNPHYMQMPKQALFEPGFDPTLNTNIWVTNNIFIPTAHTNRVDVIQRSAVGREQARRSFVQEALAQTNVLKRFDPRQALPAPVPAYTPRREIQGTVVIPAVPASSAAAADVDQAKRAVVIPATPASSAEVP